MIRKSIFITLLLLFLAQIGNAQWRALHKKNHEVNKTLDEIKEFEPFSSGCFAFYAIDLNSGEEIAFHNPNKTLKPGSTQKLFSTATALELLSPDYTFETQVYYSGSIDTARNTLKGNIYINGGGDPTLGSKYFDETKGHEFLKHWTGAIKLLDIDTIQGRVIANAQTYSRDIVPPSWSWQNMGNYFGAGPSGLSIYDNYYTVYFNTGQLGDTTEITKIEPEIKNLVIDNSATADTISWDNTNIFGAPYSNYRYIRGTLPIQKNNFGVKGSTPDPAYLAATEFENTLNEFGVKVLHKATTCRRLGILDTLSTDSLHFVYTTISPTLKDIITQTNVHSVNLFAEHCMVEAGKALQSKAETVDAANAVEEFWKEKGMNTTALYLHDGSGLSHYNSFTPKQMVYLLNYMKNQSTYFDAFYESMAVGGKSGTLKYMFKNSAAEGNIHAKSGTVNKAKAYAGYVTSASGREIAFSMMANNFSCSSREARAQLEKLMISLAELSK